MNMAGIAIFVVHFTVVINLHSLRSNNAFYISPGCLGFNVKQTLETENKG